MADTVLVLGWNNAVAGREKQAWELFGKAVEFYTAKQGGGKIENFEPIILSRHGGDLNGFILIRGNADQIDQLRRDDTYLDLVTEAAYCLTGFGAVDGFTGEGTMNMFARWTKVAGL
jgi:hypothetical protein